MTEIRDWLAKLDLGQYAEVFAGNDIDLEVLPLLTDVDLEKLGLSLGHRKRLLNAAAFISDNSRRTHQSPAQSDAIALPRPERRQLTVMFCDLAGATEMSTRLDPEELRDILNKYRRICAGAIQRFNGHIAQYLGDGVLVYFGYPLASEDAADQAVFAGLEILKVITESNDAAAAAAKLTVRIGIATGDVVAGDQIGTDAIPELAVVGETPNLAARLQSAAQPGQVIVSESTRRLTRRKFPWQGPHVLTLKGFGDPIQAWQINPSSDAPDYSFAADGLEPTQLVGRRSELALLAERLDAARTAEGQVAVLIGEAGIGKTMLSRALLEKARSEHVRCVEYGFSRFHQNSELWPFAAYIERAAGIDRRESPKINLDRLTSWLGEHDQSSGISVGLFAALIVLPIPLGDELGDLTPGALREKTLSALETKILGSAKDECVLLIFEDVHWMDPTSAELLKRLVDGVSGRPFLIFATARPEFKADWTQLPHVTSLSLSRMSSRDATDLIKQVAGANELGSDTVKQLLARAQGNPLFVEELTKSVLEASASPRQDQNGAGSASRNPPMVPASLRDSLMERLDRLGPAKETAQAAAVIGQEFDERLLEAIVNRTSSERQRDLNRLIEAQIVVRKIGEFPAIYGFRHALIQETAYQSLLKARRREIHLRVAEALDAGVVPETRDRAPERIAQHYAEAGAFDRAIAGWQSSGIRASERSASLEAAEQLGLALDLVRRHTPTAERAAKELPLLTALGPALMATRGWNAPEVRAVYDEALRLAGEMGQSAELFPVLWGRWLTAHAGGEAQIARDLLRQLFDLIKDGDHPDLLMQAHHAGCSTMCTDGVLSRSLEHMEAALAIYDFDTHRHQAMQYAGHDPCVCMLCIGSLAERMLGHAARSQGLSNDARTLANKVDHVPTIAHAQWYAAELCQILNEPVRALGLADDVLGVAIEKGISQYFAWSKMVRGWALVAQRDADQGLSEMQEGYSALRAAGGLFYHLPHRLGMRAQTYALAGRYGQAADAIGEAVASVQRTGERWYEAELLRIKAEIFLSGPTADVHSAEKDLEQAIATASHQGAFLWESRARIDLAKLLAAQQRESAACGVLDPLRTWSSEIDLPERFRAETLRQHLGR